MKSYILIFISSLCLLLNACTSEEGALKKRALEFGQAQFQNIIQKEAEENISQSEWLRQAYSEFMQKNSEVEVEDVKFQGDHLATVSLVVTTYSTPLRRNLLGVAGKVDLSKSRRFNFSEAVNLIGRQLGSGAKKEKQPLTVLKFSKNGNTWAAEVP